MKALVVTFAALLLSSCGTTAVTPTPVPEPTRVGTLTFTEAGCAFEPAVASVRPGPISMPVFNRTPGTVHLIMVQIADGHTFQEFEAETRRAIEMAEGGTLPGGRGPAWMLGWAPLPLGPGTSTDHRMTAPRATFGIMCVRAYEQLAGRDAPYDLAGPIEVR